MEAQHEDHLTLAKRHVLEGEQRVAQQTALVAQLAAGGHDTTRARVLLETLIQSLEAMRTHLQILLDEQYEL